MFKQMIIALFAISVVALLLTDANADCISIGGSLFCADWLTGSGMPTGLVTGTVSTALPANNGACPAVTTSQFFPDPPGTSLTLTLAGDVPTNTTPCGLGSGQNRFCDIQGVVLCGTSTSKNVDISGPLTVNSPGGFAQTDFSTNNANFRFQLDPSEQTALCGTDTFEAFFAREGFFEACVTVTTTTTSTTNCIRQFCTVNLGGIQPDRPRLYNCHPV